MADFTQQFPSLSIILRAKNLPFSGIFTNADAAKVFGVSVRTIQEWVRDRKLSVRDLPGRGKFLAADLEELLNRRPAGGER